MNIYDPLSIIIKLGIFSKKKIGTKLSIKNYIIEIHNISCYQGLFRFFNNDSRYDIELLGIPIDNACRKYLTSNFTILYPNIIDLFKFAQCGLMNLIKLYNNKIINQYILQIIDNINKHIINLPCNSLMTSNKSLIPKNKSFERNKSVDSIKTLESNKSTDSLMSLNNVKSNKTIIRYSNTGYFILNDDNIATNIENNNDDNYDNDNKNIDISDDIWNSNNIKFMIILMDNYINNNEIMGNLIELFMTSIENMFINNILYKKKI